MIYIDVTRENEWVLNINNNVRDFGGVDKLIAYRFTHVLSNRKKTVTCPIDQNPSGFDLWGVTNARYVEFYLNPNSQWIFPYDGEYSIEIWDPGDVDSPFQLLYKGIWKVTGNSAVEENPFVEYQSDNEDNTSYIYIEE